MQQYDPYGTERPYIIEKPRLSVRRSGRILGAVVLLAVAAVIGVFVWRHFAGSGITVKGRTFYAVYTSETSVESEAQSAAAVMKAAGGSGYIYNDGTYKIVAAVYPDASSADTVAERLTGEGMQAARLELEVPRMRLDFPDETVRARLGEAVYYTYGELYDLLYDMSVELDEQRLSESAAVRLIAQYREKAAEYAEYIAGLAEADPADKTLTGLKNAYAAVTGALSDIQSAEDVRPSARVKYAIADILVTMRALSGNL